MKRRSSILVGMAAWLFASCVSPAGMAGESICYGSPSKGRLKDGAPLPLHGVNFTAYSRLARMLDRNYVHSRVAEAVVRSYASLANSHPDTVFVYGETGHAEGGRFPPHRTHQNGLSVDFMVPIRDAKGKSIALPTWPWSRFGYDLEFDRRARLGEYRIDFEAVAAHLHALNSEAEKLGLGIARVIFDPNYLPMLFSTKHGSFLKAKINFMKRPAWVRHDEHYHVDFSLPCRRF